MLFYYAILHASWGDECKFALFTDSEPMNLFDFMMDTVTLKLEEVQAVIMTETRETKFSVSPVKL